MHIGIDPGKDGGVAILKSDGSIFQAYKMPDGYRLADRLAEVANIDGMRVMAWLERVGSMPGQGVRSMFTFGEGYGMVQGILIALRIPYQLVSPFVWQRTMHEGINRKSFSKPKERSLRAVRQFYPEYDLTPGRLRVPHAGIVDAILIAGYGRRKSLGEFFDKKVNQNGGASRKGAP